MNAVEEFNDWMQKVGTTDSEKGHQESEEWVIDRFGTPDEFSDLIVAMANEAMKTAIVEGELLNAGIAIAYIAFRYGVDFEAKKHLPTI